jgi:sulfur carrier protein ThiS
MTLDDAIKKINTAPKGGALEVANAVIPKLSADDKELAGGDLESMAIQIDDEDGEF